MENALSIFALAIAVSSVGFVSWVIGRIWLRAKELDRGAPELTAILKQVDERLHRLEQAVDSTAIEVERISEAQRFAARQLGAGTERERS